QTSRAVDTPAGSGLSGGGDLSANRSLSVDINGLTAETTADDNDAMMIHDAGSGQLRKMTRGDLLSGIVSQDRSYGSGATSPDDAVFVDNLGQVGIGTSVPQEKLDVEGNIRSRSALELPELG